MLGTNDNARAASWRDNRTDFVDMAMSGYKRGGRVGPWPDRSRKRTPHKHFLKFF